MDFQSAMETFAEAWVAANAGQQNQALALTRAANAAAAVAAANAKTPPEHHALHSDIVVKKELSLSPSNSRHTPSSINNNNNNNNNSNNNNINPQTTSVNITHNQSPPTSTAQQHRRNSLQGVQDKLSQLQQLQSQQQHQHQHHHHHQQQQPQQQKQNHNDAQRSPPYAARVMSAHNTTPSPLNISGEITTTPHPPATSTPMATSSQQCSTPKISERSEDRTETQSIAAQRLMGSITCLPPSALNAAAAAAVSAHHQPASATVSGPTLPVHTHAAAAAAAAAMESQRRSDFDVTKVNSKSLPLHCVVESVHSLQASLNIDNRSPWKRRPNVETDSYVIVAAATPWSEIVHTALQRLGYSQETAATARGSLIIKNWKPIPLEQISENPMIPVCDIIGELTSVVTLRIVIMRCKPSPFGDIKDKLLKLLVLQSHALLRSTGCPLDEVTLSQICRSSYQSPFAFPGGDIPEEMRRKFDQWWSNQLSPQSSMTPKMLPFMAGPPPSVSSDQSLDHSMGTAALAAAAAAAAAAQVNLHAASSVTGNVPANMGPTISSGRDNLMIVENPVHHPPGIPQNSAVAAAAAAHHAANMMVHPVMHAGMHHHHHHPHHPHHPHGNLSAHAQFSNQKTRMRTSFDPEMELPRLQKWFQENPHPSRQQIQTYVVQLNALESRRGRKPLDVNNVVYWFKNARAAQKRAEMRGGLGVMHAAMNGYLTQHSQLGHTSGGSSAGSMGSQQQMMAAGLSNLGLGNDFMKSPLSLKSEDIDTMSQHSDDMEDDTSRPPSPQLPLSLTMHERNQTCTERTQQEDNNNGHQNNNENTIQGPMAEKERNLIERSDGMYGGKERMDLTMPTHENTTTSSDKTDSRMTLDMKETQVQETQKLNENLYNEQHPTITERIGESLGGSNNNNSNNNNNINNNNTTSNSHINNESHQASMSRANTPKSQYCPKEEEDDLDMDEDDDDNDTSHLDDFRSPSPDMSSAMMAATGAVRKDLPFPIVPNSMFSQSFMYMSHYMPGFGQAAAAAAHPHAAAAAHHAAAAAAAAGLQPNPLIGAGSLNLSNISNEERRKRNRTFIDPVTEVPKLEQWFAMNTHPSHNLILKYTEDLNTMPYRQKFPRLESKNVQFWFKNRRAKCKRLKMSLYDNNPCPQMSNLNSFVHKYDERD